MRSNRYLAPALLGISIILAACGQATANPTSPTPTLPTASPVPSDSPTPAPSDSPAPTEAPAAPTPEPQPTPVQVVVHELPMQARATDDGVNVRTHPSLDAPLLTGERMSDLSPVPNIRLAKGDLVYATMGPVFADGESWYEVAGSLAGDVNFAFGWVAGRYLSRADDMPGYFPVIANIHGQGAGGSVSWEVPMGSPITVRFAAGPLAGRDSCDIDVTLVRTDGTAVNVATETLTDVEVHQLASFQLPSLFQEEAGTVSLHVETDCSFAASLTMPQA